jgi:hypothetical protein
MSTDLVHLLCGHPYPTRDSLIYVGDDIGVKALADSVLTDEAPKYRHFDDAGAL